MADCRNLNNGDFQLLVGTDSTLHKQVAGHRVMSVASPTDDKKDPRRISEAEENSSVAGKPISRLFIIFDLFHVSALEPNPRVL